MKMDDRIEGYFQKTLSKEDVKQFEADLASDTELARSFALYVAAREAVKPQSGKDHSEKYPVDGQKNNPFRSPCTTLRKKYVLAAMFALLGFGLSWYFLVPRERPLTALADGYAMEHFTTLGVHRGDADDSLQAAKDSFNKGQYASAHKICEHLLKANPNHGRAHELAGIIALKMLNYDTAVAHFHQLSVQKNIYPNPGKFYEAIALIKSGEPLNKKKAESLLNNVITSNLEGKIEAEKWLK
jgi:tetratricopeptide (TPR) repeat protein